MGLSDDPFTTLAASYDPDKFYVASRNKKGFGTTIRITVPPEILQAMSEVVQSGRIKEFRTQADVFRNFMVHGLHQLRDKLNDATWTERLDSYVEALVSASEAEKLMVIVESREQSERYLRQALDSVRRLSDWEQTRALPQVYHVIEATTDPELKRIATKIAREISGA